MTESNHIDPAPAARRGNSVNNGDAKGRRSQAAAMIAAGATPADVAAALNRSVHTVRNWCCRKDFRQRVDRLRQQYCDAAAGVICESHVAAVRTLVGQLAHADANVAFRAADKLLSFGQFDGRMPPRVYLVDDDRDKRFDALVARLRRTDRPAE